MIRQSNSSVIEKLKTGWVLRNLEKKRQLNIWGQNSVIWWNDEPLNWETAEADFLVIFKNPLPLEDFDNAE